MLTLDGVVLRFGGLVAVDQLSLRIAERSITALIGPNGAGKTTAFNLIDGVYAPMAGTIRFRGREIAGMKPHQVNAFGIARTYQNIRLFNQMTALENVMVGRHTRATCGLVQSLLRTPRQRLEERALDEKAHEILEFVGLAPRAAELAMNLPYGEQKRLEIARALASDPHLLLLDEPVAGMNAREKADLRDVIQRIRERGKTIFLVEHDMKIVMGVADTVYVMNYGKCIAVGTPEEVQRNPVVIEAYLGSE